MIIEMVNMDGVFVNVDPETVERVLETEAAGVSHLVIGGTEIAVASDWRAAALLIEKARGTPCPVRLIPPADQSATETAVLPKGDAQEHLSEAAAGNQEKGHGKRK